MISSFVLKVIACISMLFDHSGYIIFGKFSIFNYIGRIAFPIFAYQISEGYIHTSNLKKYFARLGLFAIISQIPYMIFIYIFSKNLLCLNIFFTLLIGLFAIYCYDKIPNKLLGIVSAIFLAIIADFLHTDYGAYGVAIIFLFYAFRNNKVLMSVSFIVACIIKYSISILKQGYFETYGLLCICTCLPIIFILLYNGKKGKDMKRFLYWFYPIHLLILDMIYLL